MLRYVRNCLVGLEAIPNRIFTVRQIAIFLSIYQDAEPHSVRRLADQTGIPKTDVTRSLYRLEEAGLIRRRQDPRDRRSVLLLRTMLGGHFCQTLRRLADAGRPRGAAKLSASLFKATKSRRPDFPVSMARPYFDDSKRKYAER